MSDSALLARFRSIAAERLAHLDGGLLELEQGTGTGAALDDVMREIHTLKGESRMLGLLAMNRVAHRTEDVLQHARRAQAFRDPALLEVAFAGLGLLRAYVEEPEATIAAADEPRAQAFEARAAALLAERGAAPAPVAAPSTPSPAASPASAPAEGGPAESGAAAAPGRTGVVRVTIDVVDDLTRTAGVLGLLQARIERTAQGAADLEAGTADALRALRDADDDASRAAILGRVREFHGALGDELRALRDACFAASLRQQRLRDAVSTLRLAALGSLFGRFPRTVRDLAQELGKEARVEIVGADLGADQHVLDVLGDPLLHLVRNALDHGLEPSAAREALGKPRHGTIRLRAVQAGRFIEVVVADDGRGIDPKAVGEAVIAKGLLSESDVARMSAEELYEQLFRPAFSTKTGVTDLSGRGVGLDVVKRVVEGLGGRVVVRSEVGRGTEFVLRVPVSTALIDALVVEAGRSLFAVPAAWVERVFVAAEADLERTGSAFTVRLPTGDRAVVLDLGAGQGGAGQGGAGQGGAGPRVAGAPVPLVLVAEGERRLALRVDRFLGEHALVQEALDPFLQGLRGVTGTAVLADGRLAAILSVVQVFGWAREEGTNAAPPPAVAPPAPRVAVVAEDSELTRSLVAATLRKANLQVIEAVDGRDALARMRERRPAILVTDLEMPGMDGIELVRRVRADPTLKDVPVLVLTTHEEGAWKRQVAEAGVDAYLVKREFEEAALLEAVAALLARGEGKAP